MAAQAQFRQPLPPNAVSNVTGVRIMNPNIQMQRPPMQGPQGQVSGNGNPMTTRPGTFLLLHRQQGNPNAGGPTRMMMVQRGQLGPQQQRPVVSQNSSPLLAQHLAGRMPNPQTGAPQDQQSHPQIANQQMPSQQQQQSQQQQSQPQQPQSQQPQQQQGGSGGDDLENLDNVPNELGDLGVAEEDLLGMGDNFDILEFADALDDLDNLPEGEKKAATSTSEANATSTTTSQSNAGATPATQPPPYTKNSPAPGVNAPPQGATPIQGASTTGTTGTAGPVRGPPPPYPGQQPPPTTSKVCYLNIDF